MDFVYHTWKKSSNQAVKGAYINNPSLKSFESKPELAPPVELARENNKDLGNY